MKPRRQTKAQQWASNYNWLRYYRILTAANSLEWASRSPLLSPSTKAELKALSSDAHTIFRQLGNKQYQAASRAVAEGGEWK